LLWDDWGGWYDPAPPPQITYTRLGFRVGLVVISPYARPAYVSHTQYDFGSILRYIEQTFNLGSLGTTDASANSLADMLNLKQTPNKFKAAPLPRALPCAKRNAGVGDMQRIIQHDGGVPE
jgi:phospholipase C